MDLVRYAVPVALLSWFLWGARKNRLFLLGVPVLMAMYYSVFFNRLRPPFWIPGRFSPQEHLVLALAVVLVLMIALSPPERRRRAASMALRFLPEELLVVAFAAIIGLHVVGGFSRLGDLAAALSLAVDALLLVVGYVLIRTVLSLASRGETIDFIRAIVITNTVVAVLYVLHQGLHLPIYSGGEYYSTVVDGVQITRTFRFAPVFTPLALGYILAMRKWRPLWLVALGINVLSLVLTYTRTLVIAAAIAVLAAIVVRELRNPDAGRMVRRATVIVGSTAAAIFAFRLVRPVEFGYLLNRFQDVVSAGGASEVGNWQLRQARMATVSEAVSRRDSWFGFGFPDAGSNPIDGFIYTWTWDSTWLPILYRFGWVGLIVMVGIVVAFGVRALGLALSVRESTRYYGSMFLITTLMTGVMTLWGPTFMDPIITLGFWPFAFVAVEALRPAEVSMPVDAGDTRIAEVLSATE